MNKTVVITGASSGIGEAFARILAARGYSLILTGRRTGALSETAEACRGDGGKEVTIEERIIELTDSAALEEFAEELRNRSDISGLINNAGFGLDQYFFNNRPGPFLSMVKVHCDAPLLLCAAVLPGMIKQNEGFIINVSSVASFFSAPKSGIYCASKSFLNKLSESLHMEVSRLGVRVQALCPGFTRSDFHNKMDIPSEKLKNKGPVRWMAAEEVAGYSLRCLRKKNKVICVPGFWNKLMVSVSCLIPRRLFYRIAGSRARLI